MRLKEIFLVLFSLFLILSYFSIPANASSTSKTSDMVKPVISGVSNKSIYIGQAFKPLSGVTAKDKVDGNLTKKIKVSGSVNSKKAGKYTLTYSVTNKAGNKATAKRVITVKKNTIKPTLSGVSNKTIFIGQAFKPLSGVTAKDKVDGNLTKKIKVSGSVNSKKAGKYTLKYSVTNKAGNTTTAKRVITVVNNIKPIISGIKDTQINVRDTFLPLQGISASDEIDGDLTSYIKVIGTVNSHKPGTYRLTYSVTNKAGNTTTAKRVITVVNNIKPIISGIKDTEINVGDTFLPLQGISASDEIDGDLTSSIKVIGTVDSHKPGSYTLTYSVTNKAGNTTTAKRVITVKDAPLTLLDLNKNYLSPDNNMTVNVKGISIMDAGSYYQYTITYTQTNNTNDLKIDEGSFKIYYSDGTSEPQYGFFSSLYPGESINRSYTFKAFKGQTPICIEYAEDNFFSTKPMKDSLKWAVQ